MISVTVNILFLLGLSLLGFRLLKSDLPSYVYWTALLFKLISGIALGLIFSHYYNGGDTFFFFERAKDLLPIENQPRTQFFVSFLKPFVWITDGSYWLTSLWLSFISFIASWYTALTISKFYTNYQSIITISLLSIPSVVFWSSGVMKDSLAFTAIALVVSQIISSYREVKLDVLKVVLITFPGWVLLEIKHYLFISILVFGGTLFTGAAYYKLKGSWKWVIIPVAILTISIATQIVHPYLNISRLPWVLYENNKTIAEKTDTKNNTGVILNGESWGNLISEIPNALKTGLFRPSIFDNTPIWGWVHRLENLLLTFLIVMSVFIYFKLKPKIDQPLFFASITSIILLAIMLPLSTPNFGSLVRYKNAYLPYLFLISSILPFRYLTSKTND